MVLTRLDMMSGATPAYVRHKPEQTLLYQLVEQYWPEFQSQLRETGRFLPRLVTREFEGYLACGRLENGFLRVRCESCSHEPLAWAAPPGYFPPRTFGGAPGADRSEYAQIRGGDLPPNSRYRQCVTPVNSGKAQQTNPDAEANERR